jgi:outer membrane protein TolC
MKRRAKITRADLLYLEKRVETAKHNLNVARAERLGQMTILRRVRLWHLAVGRLEAAAAEAKR